MAAAVVAPMAVGAEVSTAAEAVAFMGAGVVSTEEAEASTAAASVEDSTVVADSTAVVSVDAAPGVDLAGAAVEAGDAVGAGAEAGAGDAAGVGVIPAGVGD
jgi:hypothetical protein